MDSPGFRFYWMFIFCLSALPATAMASTPIQLSIQDPVDSVFAYDTFSLSAKIFDRNNVEVRQIRNDSIDTCFTWTWLGNDFHNTTCTFIDSTGPTVTLQTNYSYVQVKIRCSFIFGNSYFADDTICIPVYYRDTFSLFIEGSEQREANPLRPQPLDTIRVGSSFADTLHVYAIIRDKYGNCIHASRNALWFASSPVFQINGGNDTLGEAQLFSETPSTGTAMIRCVDTLLHLSDSAVVVVYETTGSLRSRPQKLFSQPSTISSFFDIRGRRVATLHSSGVYISRNGTLQSSVKITFARHSVPTPAKHPRPVWLQSLSPDR